MEQVANWTGLNHTDVASIWSVYDTLFCEVRRAKRAQQARTEVQGH